MLGERALEHPFRLPALGSWARRGGAEERRKAFEALVSRDWDRFYRFAVYLCDGHREDAEDLLAESMAEAFRSFERYRGEGFDRWLFRILSNNRIDMARRQRLRRAQSLEELVSASEDSAGYEIPDPRAEDPERAMLSGYYSEPVQQALDELPADFRVVVLLCDVEGLDYQSIADILGVPIGTVRSRLARGRERLRARLSHGRSAPGRAASERS